MSVHAHPALVLWLSHAVVFLAAGIGIGRAVPDPGHGIPTLGIQEQLKELEQERDEARHERDEARRERDEALERLAELEEDKGK